MREFSRTKKLTRLFFGVYDSQGRIIYRSQIRRPKVIRKNMRFFNNQRLISVTQIKVTPICKLARLVMACLSGNETNE